MTNRNYNWSICFCLPATVARLVRTWRRRLLWFGSH